MQPFEKQYLWRINHAQRTPFRNKGSIAGLIKGNQWLIIGASQPTAVLRLASSHLLPETDFDGPLFATAFSTPTSPEGHVPRDTFLKVQTSQAVLGGENCSYIVTIVGISNRLFPKLTIILTPPINSYFAMSHHMSSGLVFVLYSDGQIWVNKLNCRRRFQIL